MINDTLIPSVGTVIDIRCDTPDVKTFRVEGADGKKPFENLPGQCAMLSIPGVGEAMFSITSSPTDEIMEFSIKKCGCLTDWLHKMDVGQQITIRGPYGNSFPVETELKNENLLFIAGGIGVAPLRSVIRYVLAKRSNYGHVDIVYGARSAADFVDIDEIKEVWSQSENTDVFLTADNAQEGWDGHVGFVPAYIKELDFKPDCKVLVCGPPIMIKFVLGALDEMRFKRTQVFTTMELKMKCGIGKCGRCNIGNKYVCHDGPVFRFDQLGELPDEY